MSSCSEVIYSAEWWLAKPSWKTLFCVNLIIGIIWTEFWQFIQRSGKLFKIFVSLLVAIILSLWHQQVSERQANMGVLTEGLLNCVWLNLEMKWLALHLVQQPTLLANICNCHTISQYLHSRQDSMHFRKLTESSDNWMSSVSNLVSDLGS